MTFARTAELVLGDSEVEPATDAAVVAGHREEFTAAMENDCNAPQAVAVLHAVTSDGNDRLPKAEQGDETALAETLAAGRAASARVAPLVDDAVERRATARAEKDFATADAVRDGLAAAGIVLEDRPTGPRWYVDPETLTGV